MSCVIIPTSEIISQALNFTIYLPTGSVLESNDCPKTSATYKWNRYSNKATETRVRSEVSRTSFGNLEEVGVYKI